MARGGIVYWEIEGEDVKGLSAFYDGLFGWGGNEFMPNYFGATTPEGSPDGAVSAPTEGYTNGVTIYIEVDSIDETLAQIEAAGGSTMTPRTVVPDTVIYATFKDPAGNRLGLIEPTPDS